MIDKKFRIFRLCLLIESVCFGLQGLSWIVLGSFDPFGLWDSLMFRMLFAGQTIAEVTKFKAFILGPFGATLAGYYVLVFCLVKFAFPKREPWAYWTVVGGVLLWFVPDTIASLYHGAWFNVLLVNLPCITLMGIPLLGLFPYFRGTPPPTAPATHEKP